MHPTPPKTCCIGVLNHEIYANELVPVVEKARRSATADEAMAMLRGLIARLPGAEQARPLEQYDKLVNAVQAGRWLRSPAGLLVECICVEEAAECPDLLDAFDAAAPLFFKWNEEHTHTLLSFFGSLSDHTLPWASSGDTWRAILPPDAIAEATAAMGELTRRDVHRMLADAEDGSIYSDDEAGTLADWWDNMRRILRLAHRQERGFYIAIRTAV